MQPLCEARQEEIEPMTTEFEVQPNCGAVLVFDGRVLDIFGYANIHRFHLWQQPRLEFIDGLRPRVLVRWPAHAPGCGNGSPEPAQIR